ncbi:MAG: SpoIIE family protein phosphatase [Bacteroidia bacterium]|nr:SpoIIE family protein phosphatase [Bacteroidia bacterium]
MVEGANDAIIAVHASTGQVLYANPATERLLKQPLDGIVGQPFPSICASEAVLRSAELIADAWEQGGAISAELLLLSQEGEKIPVEVSTKVTQVAQQPGIILYIRDIRERLRLQRIIEEKNQQLLESIEYARRLQVGALPSLAQVQVLFPRSFLLYLPRDIVSGDFYWIAEKSGKRFLAVGDCTGHGVPGAMMVMLSLAFLNQALSNLVTPTPAQLLTFLHRSLCNTFDTQRVRDGADILLLEWSEGGMLRWASANRPLWYFREGEIIEEKGERAPVGGSTDPTYVWSDRLLSPIRGRLFLSTDGYADQFGGERAKKLTTGRFKRLLGETASLPLAEQAEYLRRFFSEWKGNLEQVDDVLVVGLEL